MSLIHAVVPIIWILPHTSSQMIELNSVGQYLGASWLAWWAPDHPTLLELTAHLAWRHLWQRKYKHYIFQRFCLHAITALMSAWAPTSCQQCLCIPLSVELSNLLHLPCIRAHHCIHRQHYSHVTAHCCILSWHSSYTAAHCCISSQHSGCIVAYCYIHSQHSGCVTLYLQHSGCISTH